MESKRAYNTGLIAAMMTALIAALVTGIALLPVYKSDPAAAHSSVASIASAGFLGFLRSIHHWSSAVIIVLGAVYIVTGIFRGAYHKPGQGLWIGSIVMFLIGVAMQITGHLLPYDVQAVRTAVVETGIAENAPVIGTVQGNLMRGGETVGPATLHLWHLAHVAVFAVICLALVFLLPSMARKLGTTLGRRAWIIGSFVVILILSIALKPPLGAMASASDFTDSGARPEWYIIPLHSLLVIAQNINPRLAFIGTMVIPGLALLLLVALPWLQKNENSAAPKVLGVLAALGLGGMFFYSIADVAPIVGDQIAAPVDSGYPGTPEKLDPKIVAQGRELFTRQGCNDCHMIHGVGGKIGPDLSDEGSKGRSIDWEARHIADPKSMTPGSTMPKFSQLPKDQLTALAQYVLSLKK